MNSKICRKKESGDEKALPVSAKNHPVSDISKTWRWTKIAMVWPKTATKKHGCKKVPGNGKMSMQKLVAKNHEVG